LKTLAARNIVTNGSCAFFIDVEGEYNNLCKKLGGKVIKIEQGVSAGINPFELEKDIKGNTEFLNILDKVAEIRALLATICRNYMGRTLNATEITEIEIIVNQLYAEKGITSDVNSLYEKNGGKLENGKYAVGKIPKKMPTLSDFQKRLYERNKCKELSQLLVPFLRGNSLGLFDCESKINSNSEIISFDMSEIKDEFTKLYASFVILTWVWQRFILKNKEKKKIIVCDEAWLFLKYQESAEFLVNVARRRTQV
jgi:type IV secretory pathway VirB4 component